MDFTQKSRAIKALADVLEVRFHDMGWAATAGNVEVRDNGLLMGVTGRGRTPETAVDELFERLTNVPAGQYLVVNAYSDQRRAVRWNGFMWAQVNEPVL